jgi:hypothetical protein
MEINTDASEKTAVSIFMVESCSVADVSKKHTGFIYRVDLPYLRDGDSMFL